MMSRNTLLLLQAMLGNQQILVSAADEEIAAVLLAKKELAEAIAELDDSTAEPDQ